MRTIDDVFGEPVFFLQAQMGYPKGRLEPFVDVEQALQRAHGTHTSNSLPKLLRFGTKLLLRRDRIKLVGAKKDSFYALKGMRQSHDNHNNSFLREVCDSEERESMPCYVRTVGFGYNPLSWNYARLNSGPRLFAIVDGISYVNHSNGIVGIKISEKRRPEHGGVRPGLIIARMSRSIISKEKVDVWLNDGNLEGVTGLYKENGAEDKPTLKGRLEALGYGRFVPSERKVLPY